jgi:hypothetical protein
VNRFWKSASTKDRLHQDMFRKHFARVCSGKRYISLKKSIMPPKMKGLQSQSRRRTFILISIYDAGGEAVPNP